MTGPNHIYALIDPFYDMAGLPAIRYIGKTNNLGWRYYNHMRGDGSNVHKDNWLKRLKALGARPEIISLATCGDDWADHERYWIRFMREQGHNLINKSDGGNVPPDRTGSKHSEEHKAKMSELMRGNQWNKGNKHSLGKHWVQSPEARARAKGRPSNAKGKKWSEESRQKQLAGKAQARAILLAGQLLDRNMLTDFKNGNHKQAEGKRRRRAARKSAQAATSSIKTSETL